MKNYGGDFGIHRKMHESFQTTIDRSGINNQNHYYYLYNYIHNLQSVKNQEKNKRHRKRSLMFLTMILNKINRH